jgi:hypothetical protein
MAYDGTIYDALHESHERQRSLCRKLLRTKAHDQRRIDLFRELRIELAAHEAAEERHLYVPMLMDDRGLDSSRHALHEHHELDELVEKLREGRPGDRGWMATARALSRQVHHHLREEETRFFQVSGKILSDTQKQRLGRKYLADYRSMHRKLSADAS